MQLLIHQNQTHDAGKCPNGQKKIWMEHPPYLPRAEAARQLAENETKASRKDMDQELRELRIEKLATGRALLETRVRLRIIKLA
jgi:hypothetical protein